MKQNMITTPVARWGILSSAERAIITVGLLLAVVPGFAGGLAGPGTMQTILYAVSSLGLVSATMVLALRHARIGQSHTLVAAGMALLTIAEMLLWAGGRPGDAGYDQTFAGGVMFYVPALLLISVPRAYPLLVRIIGVLASLPWAAFAVRFLTGETPSYADTLASTGYAFLGLTMIAWVVVLGRTDPQ
jgi:hypothetical protein